jgi:hypothetical protein
MRGRYLTAAGLRDLAAQMSERDITILRRVSDLRFVSGGQLARLHFAGDSDPAANARAARRALLRLTRLDCLERLPRRVGGVRAGSAGFVYRLGLAGQRLAEDRGWQPKRRGRRSQIPGTLFLSHALQVAELHTLLTESDRSGRLELLELSAEPACWRSYGGAHTQRAETLKPDSYVRLGAGEYEDSYFIEVDRGTEGSRALEGQLKRYLAYQASGIEQAERGVFPRTLWLAPDAGRADAIRGCIARLPSPAQELFAVTPFSALLNVLTSPAGVTHRQSSD